MRLHVLLGALGLGVLSIAALSKPAQACGGCFQPPTESGDVITDEKMIFRITPQATTLYDEIEYSGSPSSFGWVLPIRGPVTVGLSSDLLFQSLEQATATVIQAPQIQSCACANGYAPGANAATGGGSGGASPPQSVTVISQQTVGPYDTVQLKSTDPNALNAWLAANGYVVPNGFQSVIAAYVSEGFDFLALKLAPGQGVAAMRPVRVTTPGAGLSLPLRMVAAGTGATVGVTVWLVADGRYEPTNMPTFTIDPSEITWDFKASTSDYASIRQFKEAEHQWAAWQIESSIDVSPYQVEGPVMAQPAEANYPVDGDAGAGDSTTAEQADLDTLFPGGQSDVRVTRLRSDLSHTALANDLVVGATKDQSTMSNFYQVTKSVNAPSCQPTYCGGGGGGPGPFGSSGGGSIFGTPPATGGTGSNSSCAAAPPGHDVGSDTWVELGLAGVLGASILGKRLRRRRTS